MTTDVDLSATSEEQYEHPGHHTGIGFTQMLAFGLVAFSVLMVIFAVVINLILGTPGG